MEKEDIKLLAKTTQEAAQEALVQMLRLRYQQEKGAVAGSVCSLCGANSRNIRRLCNGLQICENCHNSEVISISTAAELLFTTYGNFRRMFPATPFRYPNLEISSQSMHEIDHISHGDTGCSGLVTVLSDENEGFSLRILKDIPYGFLEELYAQTFSQLLEKDLASKTDIAGKQTWVDYTCKYLEEVGRKKQSELLIEAQQRA